VSSFMNKFRQLGFIDYNGHLEVHSSLLNVVLHDEPHIRTWNASNLDRIAAGVLALSGWQRLVSLSPPSALPSPAAVPAPWPVSCGRSLCSAPLPAPASPPRPTGAAHPWGPGGPMTYKILLIIALMAPILLVAIGAMVYGPPHRRAPKKGELGLDIR